MFHLRYQRHIQALGLEPALVLKALQLLLMRELPPLSMVAHVALAEDPVPLGLQASSSPAVCQVEARSSPCHPQRLRF